MMIHAERQPFLEGLVNTKTKSVTMPPATSGRVRLPQNGIPIGSEWKLGADSMNIILYRKDPRSKTGERWRAEGYYSTIGNALVGLVRQGVRDTELESLQAVQDKIAELEHDILKMAAGR